MSAARVTSPQDLYSLGLGDTYNFTRNATRINKSGGVGGFFFDGGTAGNADLDPYRANQGLISYENYFKKGDVISVEGFIKEIESFVETQNVVTSVPDDFGSDLAHVSKPVNAGGGQVAGFELNGIYNFGDDWTPWPWLKRVRRRRELHLFGNPPRTRRRPSPRTCRSRACPRIR